LRLRPLPPRPKRRRQGTRQSQAQKRLPVEVRQQLLDAIYADQPFPEVRRELGLISNQVWGLAKTDHDLEAAASA
jgi:hypothetical protein